MSGLMIVAAPGCIRNLTHRCRTATSRRVGTPSNSLRRGDRPIPPVPGPKPNIVAVALVSLGGVYLAFDAGGGLTID
jgi:hypothetical protein